MMKKHTSVPFWRNPRIRYGSLSTLLICLALAALIVLNLAMTSLEKKHGWRMDYSFNALTTHSEKTLEILAQLELIRDGSITDIEMEAARKSLCSAMTQMQDEPESMAAWHFSRRLSGNDITVNEELEQIASVTKQQIADAAQKISLDTVYFMEGTLSDGSAEEEYDDED